MPFIVHFLNIEQAQAVFDKQTSDSEYTRRIAMSVAPPQLAPTQQAYNDFAKSQCREFTQEEKQYFQDKVRELNDRFYQRGIDFGDVELRFALTTGKEYSFGWHLRDDVILITQNIGHTLTLADAVNPFHSIRNLFVFDLLKKNADETLEKLIFARILKDAPQLKTALLSLLGFEEISVDLPSTLSERVVAKYAKAPVKMNVVLRKTREMVSVMPLYFYNERCRFDDPFAQALISDCTSLRFFVVSNQGSNSKYHLVTKDNGLYILGENDIEDVRVNQQNTSKPNEIHPIRIIEDFFVEYVKGGKNLPTYIETFFDEYFKKNPMLSRNAVEDTPTYLVSYQNDLGEDQETQPLINSVRKRMLKKYN